MEQKKHKKTKSNGKNKTKAKKENAQHKEKKMQNKPQSKRTKITEKELLVFLSKSPTKKIKEISRDIGINEATIRNKIKKMEEENKIRKKIEINPKNTGIHKVLIGIDTKPEEYVNVLEKIKETKNIISLYSTTGDHSIIAECIFTDIEELFKFTTFLKNIKGVEKICPSIVLEIIK